MATPPILPCLECCGKMAESTEKLRSIDDILQKKLDDDELREVNRMLYGNETR